MTDNTASGPLKGTHDLSPRASATPRLVIGQQPQELEAALVNMAATNQAFLGRYDLRQEASSRLTSPQSIVAFATCRVTQKQVRISSWSCWHKEACY
jgi:hypothetical protein